MERVECCGIRFLRAVAQGVIIVGKRLRTGAAVPAQDGSDTPEAPKGGNVYAIPKWMMATICVILGLAVLGGALLAFSRLGWSPLYRETTLEAPAQTADTQPETTQPEPTRPY